MSIERISYVHCCINYNTANKIKSFANENAETHNAAARSCGQNFYLVYC